MTAWRPQREVEIVAGTPPGGGLDRSARALVKAIESKRLLDVPAKVSNVAGEGGRKAWAYLDRHPGDPHVLCISSSNLATDHLLGTSVFDHEAAFTPLAILYTEYIAFLARSDSSLKSGADLIARFATRAASVTVALSTSLGNPNHIALAKVVRHAGGDVRAPRIRVFDSALDAVADVVAGNADICAVTAASAVTEITAGTMRALAVSAPQRLTGLYAQTPTWLEQSVDCVIGAWRGVSGARGLTPATDCVTGKGCLRPPSGLRSGLPSSPASIGPRCIVDGSKLREHLRRERTEMSAVLNDLGLLPKR